MADPRVTPAVRRPVAAGSFYPADPVALAAEVDALLAAAPPRTWTRHVRALVVPHAGYVYSGRLAAAAYGALRSVSAPRGVVLAGPAHFVPLQGVAAPEAATWRTPLGDVTIDPSLRDRAHEAGAVVDDLPHEREHAVEVQLPFLMRAFQTSGSALPAVLPLAVGEGSPERAGELLGQLVAADVVLVVSSDLSHYLDDRSARRVDEATLEAFERLDETGIGDLAACGVHALRALVVLARRRDWRAERLAYATSADAGGGKARVVGYAALAFA